MLVLQGSRKGGSFNIRPTNAHSIREQERGVITSYGTQERLWQELNNMGLWKHGVEQILAEAGMHNQETERKALAR